MKIATHLSLVTLLALMAGCSSATTQQEETTPEPAEEPVVAAEPAPEEPSDVHLVDDHITIDRHINFASDSDEILSDSNDLLDHIATFLRLHQSDVAHLRVIGHTDAAGGAAHNQDLSERRAAAVVQALRDRGVSTELESSGAGETQPPCEEDTDACHAQNRRVEFLVVVD